MSTTLAKVKRNGPTTEAALDALLVARQWGYADDTRRLSIMQADGATIRRYWDSTRLADQTATYGTALIGTIGITGVTPTGGSSGAAGTLQAMLGGLATGNGNYIINGTSQQASSNFNISGAGVVGTTLSIGGAVSLLASQDILFADNAGAALTFAEGGNPYLRFVTTNAAEKITAFKALDAQSTLSVSGQSSLTGATISGGSSGQGAIYTTGTVGLAIQSKTGSSYDFSLLGTGGIGSYVMRVPTGTTTAEFPNNATVGGTLGVTGASTLTGIVGIGVAPSSNSSLDIRNASLSGTTQYGLTVQPTFTSGATSAGNTIASQLTTSGAFTMPTGRSMYILTPSLGSTTVTNLYGLQIDNQTGGGTNYAIHTGSGAVRFGDNVYTDGSGLGYWINTPGTFTYGMYQTGTSLAFRSGSTSPFLTVNSSGQPTFANAVSMSSTLGVTGVTTLANTLQRTASGEFLITNTNGSGGSTIKLQTTSGDIVLVPSSGNKVSLTNTEDSTSTSTGTLVTAGGIGIAKALWVGGLVQTATTVKVGGVFSAAGSALYSSAAIAVYGSSLALSGTSQFGIYSNPQFTSAATTAIYGGIFSATNAASTTTNFAHGVYIASNAKGSGGTINNNIGLYIEDYNLSGATNYSIYTGLGTARFGGETYAIGVTRLTQENTTFAGGTVSATFGNSNHCGLAWGSGAPTCSASKGCLYLRTDGSGTSNRAYINTDGGTTWTAITTAA